MHTPGGHSRMDQAARVALDSGADPRQVRAEVEALCVETFHSNSSLSFNNFEM